MKRAAWVLALAAGLGGLTPPRAAHAFVRYFTEDKAPFFWALPILPVTAYIKDFNQAAMTPAQVQDAVTAAAAAWSKAQNSCTYLSIVPATSDGPAPRAANDAHNALIFRSTSWCELAENGTCEVDYESSALAFTWDTANKKTGQIYDADVEVNLVDFQWADVVANPNLRNDMDLQNALTHELGHFIGLDHTCYNELAPTGPRPTGSDGNPIPNCDMASADVAATTMYPSAMPGDTQKRTLSPDDQNGLCTIYPADQPPPPDGLQLRGAAGCDVSGPLSRPLGAATLAVAALLAGRRKRRA
jgi:Metallo-peptidase family M12